MSNKPVDKSAPEQNNNNGFQTPKKDHTNGQGTFSKSSGNIKQERQAAIDQQRLNRLANNGGNVPHAARSLNFN